jgi:Tol biopolymer transport system component
LITPKDYGKWEQLGAPRLSPRGDWIAVPVARPSEENELRIRGVSRDTTIVVAYGTGAAFSPAGQWVAYAIGVSPKERERLTKDKKPVHNSFEARNLATGATIAVNDVTSFAFSPDGRFISMTRYPAEGKKVSEVLLQDLANNVRLTFANVSDQAWADAGSLLALTPRHGRRRR